MFVCVCVCGSFRIRCFYIHCMLKPTAYIMKTSVIFSYIRFSLVFYDLFKYFTNEPQPESPPPLPTPTSHRLNMQPNRMNVCSYLHSENIKCMYDFIESDNLVHAAQANRQTKTNIFSYSHHDLRSHRRISILIDSLFLVLVLTLYHRSTCKKIDEREKKKKTHANTEIRISAQNPFSKVLYSVFV